MTSTCFEYPDRDRQARAPGLHKDEAKRRGEVLLGFFKGMDAAWLKKPKTLTKYLAYADGARHKTVTLQPQELVRRFGLHLLPRGFVKIRHFGFLSNRQRKTRGAQAPAETGKACRLTSRLPFGSIRTL